MCSIKSAEMPELSIIKKGSAIALPFFINVLLRPERGWHNYNDAIMDTGQYNPENMDTA